MIEVAVRIDVETTPGGLLRYTFTREARTGAERLGTVTQVAEHRWQAHAAREQLAVATSHRSYEVAEQALMQRAGLGNSTINYTEARA